MADRTFPIQLQMQFNEMTEDAAKALGLTPCDALIAIPIKLDDETGTHIQTAITFGPDQKPLPPERLWQAWTLLAFDLASRKELPASYRKICHMMNQVAQKAQDTLMRERAAKGEPLVQG